MAHSDQRQPTVFSTATGDTDAVGPTGAAITPRSADPSAHQGPAGGAWMPRTITKKDLVDEIAAEFGLTRAVVKTVCQAFLNKMTEHVGEGNRLEFRDFGVLEVKRRAARMAQNPKTLERVPVPAKFSARFKPGRRMKELLDELAIREAQAQQPLGHTGTQPPKAGTHPGDIEVKPAVPQTA